MINDNYAKKYDEEKAKKPIFRSTITGHYYAIFRIGKKYKTLGQITGFNKHMNRLQDTPNADPNIKNEILIGNENLTEQVKEYIKDVRYKANNTIIARELLLTASPQFFKGMPELEKDKWIEFNIEWLKKEFGDNLIYCCYHRDESTPHLHCLISPKIYSEKRKSYVLSNCHYFDGVDKFREWQDKYSNEMQQYFPALHRGIRNSKAKHIEIKHFYAMVNQQLDEKDLEQLCAKAKNGELLKVKIKSIENTLRVYKDYSRKTDEEKQKIIENNLELKRDIKAIESDREVLSEALNILSQQYKLPQNAIKQVLKYAKNELDKNIER